MFLFSSICCIVQILLWWLYKFNIVKNFTNKLTHDKYGEIVDNLIKDCIDILPCILIFQFNSYFAMFFLMGCLIADKFITNSLAIGGLIFLVTYSTSAFSIILNQNFNPLYFIISFLFILMGIIIFFLLTDNKLVEKFVATVYAFIALGSCTFAFLYTLNFGFLALVIADILLVVRELIKQKNSKYEKIILSISNSFYFMALCFVPFSLY